MIFSIYDFLKDRLEDFFSHAQDEISSVDERFLSPVFMAGRSIPTVAVAQAAYTASRVYNYMNEQYPTWKREIYEGSMDAWRHHMGVTGQDMDDKYYSPESFGPKGHGRFKSVGYYRGGSANPRDFI